MCERSILDPKNPSIPFGLGWFVKIIQFPMTCFEECVCSLFNLLPGGRHITPEVIEVTLRERFPWYYHINIWCGYLFGSLFYGQVLQFIRGWLKIWIDQL